MIEAKISLHDFREQMQGTIENEIRKFNKLFPELHIIDIKLITTTTTTGCGSIDTQNVWIEIQA